MVVNFRGDQILADFVRFLIHEVYIHCLSYNICSTWFLDIRISTCFLACSICDHHCPVDETIHFVVFV